MIDLYYAPTPNGWKISIMLEEAEMEYKVIPVNLGAGDQFKPEIITKHTILNIGMLKTNENINF